jgi:hypothetical protein
MTRFPKRSTIHAIGSYAIPDTSRIHQLRAPSRTILLSSAIMTPPVSTLHASTSDVAEPRPTTGSA